MRKKIKKVMGKWVSAALAAALLLAAQGMPVFAGTEGSGAAGNAGRENPKNPLHHCTKENDGTDTTDWDYVYFGSYPQTEINRNTSLTDEIRDADYDEYGDAWVNGTKYRRISKGDTVSDKEFGNADYRYFKWERIKWKVLENDGSTLFVVADKGLDCKTYHDLYESVTWETSTLREWLNREFYGTAFSSREQGAIVRQTIANKDNFIFNLNTPGGNDTEDTIFLLSIEEVLNPAYGFCEEWGTFSGSRRIKASDYSYRRGTEVTGDSTCTCWLRSPGSSNTNAAYLHPNGVVEPYGDDVNRSIRACVPVLRIDLSSDLWYTSDDGTSGSGGYSSEMKNFGADHPLLSEEQAKMFLGFLYNKSDYEKFDFSTDPYYQLLTGDYRDVGSVDEIKQKILAFSVLVRTVMNRQAPDTDPGYGFRTEPVSEEFCTYLREGLKAIQQEDAQAVSEYAMDVDQALKKELADLLSSSLAQSAGIVFTESLLEQAALEISAENDFAGLMDEASEYLNELAAAADTAVDALCSGAQGRTMYFNQYLFYRKSYQSAEEENFKTIMDQNKTVLAMTAEAPDLLHSNAWFTGEGEWMDRSGEIDAWAECLYQLEQSLAEGYHNMVDRITPPTCTDRGYTTTECTLCGKSSRGNYQDADGHLMTEEILDRYLASEATCTEAESYYCSCRRCGMKGQSTFYYMAHPALGHEYKAGTAADSGTGTHTFECTRCNMHEEAHKGGEATCIMKKECEVCHAKYGSVDVSNHKNTEIRDKKVAVCGETGYTGDTWCKDCNTKLLEGEEIAAPGIHIWEEGGTKAPTCTEKGSKTYICSECQKTKTEEVEAAGHQNTELRGQKEAICEEAGYTGDTWCKDCNTKIREGEDIPAPGIHTWKEEVTKAPTCTEKGSKTYICSECQKTKTEEVEATGHQNTELRGQKEAICEEAGYTGDTWCKDCNTKIREGEDIPAPGIHTWKEEVTKAPTCTEKGSKTYICSECQKTKTEEVEATGHQNTELRGQKAASCGAAGYTGDTWCKDCGQKIKAGSLIKQDAHKYSTKKIPATVSANGSITEQCTVCGTVKSSITIASIHSVAVKMSVYTYNGKAKKPSVSVTDSSGAVAGNGSYDIAYKNNEKVGQASVTIIMKGNYSGVIRKSFQIVPKGTSISGKPIAKSRSFTIKWKKQPVSVSGYQIQYSTNKKFTKKTMKKKEVRQPSKTKLTVKKLKPKKRYYVRIRTYKKVKGKNYYSSWSKAKKVRIKR